MTETAPIFTILLDFRGGTYVHQVRSSSPTTALTEWVRNVDWAAIDGLTEAQYQALGRALETDTPVPVNGLQSVWCSSADLNDELALIHIVKTAGA